MWRFRSAETSRIVRTLVLVSGLVGCAASPVHYTAAFSQPDGLGPGDPVTHGGVPIGTVTSVSPAAGGDSLVTVQVDGNHTTTVRNDSILVLQGAGTTPSLEMTTVGMTGGEASDGAQLYGASNANQEQLLTNILGPVATANSYGQFFNQVSPPQASPSPGSSVLQNQLLDIMRQTLMAAAAATGATPMGRQQMDQFRDDADAVERQLDAHGKTAEAAQLRNQVAQMSAAAGASSNTLTIPHPAPTP